MKYLLLVLLCCTLCVAQAQNDIKSKAFINEVMANKSVTLYREFVDQYYTGHMGKVFNYPKLQDMRSRSTADSIMNVSFKRRRKSIFKTGI